MELFNQIIGGILAVSTATMSLLGFVPESKLIQQEILEERIASLEEQLVDTTILGGYNISGGGTYRLSSSVGTTNTTINLSSFKEPVSNIPYTMVYLNTDIAYGTIDPQTTRPEFVSFTGITQNADGTASLTGVSRGLTRTPAGSTCTASSTLAQTHTGQAVFILSDSPCHFAEYAIKRNNETISGSWSYPTPTSASNPATKGYVDSLVLGGSPTVDKLVVAGNAGESISAGNIIYLSSDGEWYKVDTDVTASVSNALTGIAQGSGTDGVAISGGVLIHGLDTNQSGLTIGANYFASSSAGSVGLATTTKGLGKARTATNLYFDPYFLAPQLGSSNSWTGANTFNGTTTLASTTATVLNNIASSTVKVYQATTTAHAGNYTWSKATTTLKYIVIEVVGGGGGGSSANGGGGGGGGYCRETLPANALSSSETIVAGNGGAAGANNGGSSSFGSFCSATGGTGTSGTSGGGGGGGTGGNINADGQKGTPGDSSEGITGVGGMSGFGGIGKGGDANNGDGSHGMVFVTEYHF
jgi:hypothetical protein